jgi:hypothetical protein
MLYTTGQDDITDAVLTEINASAPVETKPAPDAKADAKPPKDAGDAKPVDKTKKRE